VEKARARPQLLERGSKPVDAGFLHERHTHERLLSLVEGASKPAQEAVVTAGSERRDFHRSPSYTDCFARVI
jgi:hypothetical protein